MMSVNPSKFSKCFFLKNVLIIYNMLLNIFMKLGKVIVYGLYYYIIRLCNSSLHPL